MIPYQCVINSDTTQLRKMKSSHLNLWSSIVKKWIELQFEIAMTSVRTRVSSPNRVPRGGLSKNKSQIKGIRAEMNKRPLGNSFVL